MKTYLQFLILAAALFIFVSMAATARAADVPAADKKFAMQAATAGMAEVEMGKLAGDKASSTDVKDFGSKMVEDHGKANDELKSIAATKGITLPDKLDAMHQAKYDKLSQLSGAEFDKAYIADMVAGHKKVDALMKKEASSGKDDDLKAFAAKTDDTVQMHLKMAEDIQGKLK
jgi:putative membrane protein